MPLSSLIVSMTAYYFNISIKATRQISTERCVERLINGELYNKINIVKINVESR